jgi:predicted nucleotidyltransferase
MQRLLDTQENPVSALRQALREGTEHLFARYDEGVPVGDLVEARSQLVDMLLRKAWHLHMPADAGAALAAVGGYGRQELHPGSDVDILILLENSEQLLERTEAAVQRLGQIRQPDFVAIEGRFKLIALPLQLLLPLPSLPQQLLLLRLGRRESLFPLPVLSRLLGTTLLHHSQQLVERLRPPGPLGLGERRGAHENHQTGKCVSDHSAPSGPEIGSNRRFGAICLCAILIPARI